MRRYVLAVLFLLGCLSLAEAQPFSRVTILDLTDIAGTLATDDKLFIYDTSASTLKRVELNQVCTDYLLSGAISTTGNVSTDGWLQVGDSDAITDADCIDRDNTNGLFADVDCDGTRDVCEAFIGKVRGLFLASGGAFSTAVGTNEPLPYTSEDVDYDAWHSTSANTSRYTPLCAGYYQCAAFVDFNGNGASYINLRKNGTDYLWVGMNGTADDRANVSGVIYLDGVDDYVEAVVWETSGNDVERSRFSCFQVF
jgi:hypothetical protein